RLGEYSKEIARRPGTLGDRREQRDHVRVGRLLRCLVIGEVVVWELEVVALAFEVSERLVEGSATREPLGECVRGVLRLPERVGDAMRRRVLVGGTCVP